MNVISSRTRSLARRFPKWPYCVDKNSSQAQGLVLWLPMDPRGGGTVFDRSGYGHLGTLTHGPTWGHDDHGNGALSFDGDTRSVLVPLTYADGDYTVCVRVRRLAAGNPCAFAARGGANIAWQLDYFSGNYRLIWGNGTYGAATVAAGAVGDEAVAGTLTGSSVQVYRNGAGGTASTSGVAPAVTFTSARVSTYDGSNSPWTGLIGDVRLYKVALPATLVWDVYDRPAALAYPLGRKNYIFLSAQLASASSNRRKTLSGLSGLICP